VQKRLVRPREGLPANWFIEGKAPYSPEKARAIVKTVVVPLLVTTAALIIAHYTHFDYGKLRFWKKKKDLQYQAEEVIDTVGETIYEATPSLSTLEPYQETVVADHAQDAGIASTIKQGQQKLEKEVKQIPDFFNKMGIKLPVPFGKKK
jgi:hypothetical protein